MTINKKSKEIHEYAKQKGFWDIPRETGTLLMLIVSELSEAMEADRKVKYAQEEAFERGLHVGGNWNACFEEYIKDTFEDEIADAFIRLMDLCGARNINIDSFIELKLKYNIVDNLDEREEWDEVCQIEPDDFRILMNFDCPEYKPIPIDYVWAKKLGFHMRSYRRPEWLSQLSAYSIVIVKKNGKTIEFCKGSPNEIAMKIEYVHQYQNLYFAIKGEELEIKS